MPKQEEAKQEELAQHAAQGAELFQDHHYAEAEAEYRAAVKLDPQNSYLHMALSRALNCQKKTDEGMREAHLAIHLNPESDMAHFSLGNALRLQEDWAGAAAEYREAMRLNPNYDMTHNNLGVTLRQARQLGRGDCGVSQGAAPESPGRIGHGEPRQRAREQG